ncbi:MAG: hypothetical protein JNL01_12670 [Bdellovibrionales bacterium]|nr:hypothetical protein [Bdellovibrionales bacterium]
MSTPGTLILLAAFLTHALPALAQETLGHNLTPTTRTLKAGEVTAGWGVTGYGITDQWMVFTSPWMIIGYSIPLIGAKYARALDLGPIRSASFEFGSFNTLTFLQWRRFARYSQRSNMARLTFENRINERVQFFLAASMQHFTDSRVAFSLRPPPTNRTPITSSVSGLLMAEISEKFILGVESGILGVNYPNPYFHTGVSVAYRWKSGYAQLGASYSMQLTRHLVPFDPNKDALTYSDYQVRSVFFPEVLYVNETQIRPVGVLHPEIQLQFFF